MIEGPASSLATLTFGTGEEVKFAGEVDLDGRR